MIFTLLQPITFQRMPVHSLKATYTKSVVRATCAYTFSEVLRLALTTSGLSNSLIPTLIKSGILPRYAPFSTAAFS